jgi:hypothetical protein
MILNDWEYQVTQERVEGFKQALVLLNAPGNAIPDSRFPIPDFQDRAQSRFWLERRSSNPRNINFS